MAEGHFGTLVAVAGVGYFCAALVTPAVTRRLSKPTWITVLLAASAVVTAALGETFVQLAYLAIGFCLYLTRQGVAISATTILQEEVDDAYRGRAFAFYDMMFNVTYAIGAVIFAAFLPPTAARRPSSAWWPRGTRSSRPATGYRPAGPDRRRPRTVLAGPAGHGIPSSAAQPSSS